MNTIIAKLSIDPNSRDEFEQTFKKMRDGVLKNETGTSLYKLARSVESDSQYFVIEFYADKDAMQTHLQNLKSNPLMAEIGRFLTMAPEMSILEDVG